MKKVGFESINNEKVSSSSVLIAGAMDTELNPLFKIVGKPKPHKLLDLFPLYKVSYKSLKLFIVQTFVGDVNASIAGFEAIRAVNPDCVIKFGAVGGSYPESKAGDIIVPIGFFHRTAWITRNKKTNKPSVNASEWQSIFGKLPYQVNSNNLGNIPYYFPVEQYLQDKCRKTLTKLDMNYISAYIGGGNIWMFSKKVLNNVAATMLPQSSKHKRFVSDMESYSLAHASYIAKKPFMGCYVVASNDYLDEEYNPSSVSNQLSRLVPYVLDLVKSLTKKE